MIPLHQLMTSWRSKISVTVVLAGFLSLVAPFSVHQLSAQSVFDAIGKEVNSVFEKSKASIVKVRSDNGSLSLAGSGFFIDDKGTLITSAKILVDDQNISVEMDGTVVEASVVGKDLRSGLALIQIFGATTPYLHFASNTDLKPASAVIGVGYPYNLPAAPGFGLVAGFDTQYLNRFFSTTHIRCNIPISPGQVGGPLLNTKGEVVGILVMAVDGGKGCYAIPSVAAQKIISDFQKYGNAKHGWVGVGVAERAAGDPQKGVVISQLFENTPAITSGLKAGDIVLKIGNQDIRRPSDVVDVSFFSNVGESLPVTVSRQGKLMTFKLMVNERPKTLPAIYVPDTSATAPTHSTLRVNDSQ